jgi:predicted AAA+ superfamily ATPase
MGLKMEYLHRFFSPPDQSFFLFGPRGTGKSSWVRHVLTDALVVDLLKPGVFREMSARPERLGEMVLANPERSTVVVDEVQRVPELLNVVHDLVERQLGLQFVLTGSSARKLRRGGVDLLAGRAVYRTLHPFMAAELPSFDLEAALREGLLPVVVSAPDPADVLDAYATLYLEEEVRLEGWARDVGNFARFLEAASFSHAAVLNISNVARECRIERKTVAGYMEVLEDLLLSFRIPVFTRRAKRQTSVHPKFYFFDAGVYRSLRPKGPLDRAEEIDGAAFEGLVAQHLRAWVAYSGKDCELFYWRTRSGVEVDFVVYGRDGFWAIEVKNSSAVRSKDLRALRSFRDDYPECTPVFLYRGEDRLLIDGVLCVPGEEFLNGLSPNQDLT